MTRQPSPSPETPSSWVSYKELARRQYERGDYEGALTSYTSALNPDLHCPTTDQQIILSNVVACRLKIGGPAQARAAFEGAKQCVALNPQWAKGHVRLASAYIALGGHSNDACNELQRALSLDPGNSSAREMLVRELRRDHAHANTSASTSTSTSANANTSRAQQPQQQDDFDESPQGVDVDDSLTWSEWVQYQTARVTEWYSSQSEDAKTVCKIVAVVLILYVAFGGRFGWEQTRQSGNYGSNNVYDQYRRYGTTQSQSKTSYPYNRNNNQYGSSNRRRTNSYQDDYYYDQQQHHYNPRGGRGGWGGFNPMDGGIQSMLLIGGLVYAGQRLGINPFQTMMFLNMMRGGRRGGFRPRGGLGMGGFGMGRGMPYRRRRF